MTPLDFFARWRVRIGYLLAIVVLWFSRPVPRSIMLGACVGIIGLAIRAYAAGYLHKQEILTTTGPYARTRNPLYFGSSILALGAAIAMNSWLSGALVLLYFALVYSFVMRREELELRQRHGTAFDAYAQSVPLFFPRLSPAKRSPGSEPGGGAASEAAEASPVGAATATSAAGAFSWRQFRKNHEHEATLGFLLLLVALVIIWRLHVA
jgi:protein-S-isoprenylcysteine O-methyltransferase Ste14